MRRTVGHLLTHPKDLGPILSRGSQTWHNRITWVGRTLYSHGCKSFLKYVCPYLIPIADNLGTVELDTLLTLLRTMTVGKYQGDVLSNIENLPPAQQAFLALMDIPWNSTLEEDLKVAKAYVAAEMGEVESLFHTPATALKMGTRRYVYSSTHVGRKLETLTAGIPSMSFVTVEGTVCGTSHPGQSRHVDIPTEAEPGVIRSCVRWTKEWRDQTASERQAKHGNVKFHPTNISLCSYDYQEN